MCLEAVDKLWGICKAVFVRMRNNRARKTAGGFNVIATQLQFFNVLSAQLADRVTILRGIKVSLSASGFLFKLKACR